MKLLTQDDIRSIYYDKIAINNNDGYNRRYEILPPNDSKWSRDTKDFPRVVIVQELRRMVTRYGIKSKRMLTFNDYGDPERDCIQHHETYNFNYEDNTSDNDLHDLCIPNHDYDFVLLNQILEHLYNPNVCLDNIAGGLNSGSYVFCSVPVVNILHDAIDTMYTGISPLGLGCMFKSCGFEIIEIGQWGTKEYIDFIFEYHNWPDYRHLKSYVNEFNNPVQTWILARKI